MKQLKEGDVFDLKFVVSNEVYTNFRDSFKDFNPMHIDDSLAQSKGFKEKIVHGNVLNGFISNFIGEGLPLRNVVLISQTINYHKPFYINDTVFLTCKVASLVDSVKVCVFRYRFKNEEGGTIAKGEIQIKILE